MPKAKKIGRPKLPKGHAKGVIVPVRVNPEDRNCLRRPRTRASIRRYPLGFVKCYAKPPKQGANQ